MEESNDIDDPGANIFTMDDITLVLKHGISYAFFTLENPI